MASGDTKTNQYLDIAANGTRADLPTDTCCETRTQTLIRGVAERIMDVEEEVERLENNPDVVDIVATYADLEDYDTSGLTDKDIIRVLEDETHDGNSTYYRWNATTSQFDFVGEISGGSSVNVVQTTGTSTTDVMSQDATSKMIYVDPTNTTSGIAIGKESPQATSSRAIAVGNDSRANFTNSIALGYYARPSHSNSIALGAGAVTTDTGQVSIQKVSSGYGHNNTVYTLLSGLYDGQSAHDAATYGQLNTRMGGLTIVSISQTDYDALATKDPNTLYVITGA